MLVLSRKKNERIRFNHETVITVIEIRGDKVRLGIVAPTDVAIHRDEVYEQIQTGVVREPKIQNNKRRSKPTTLEDKAILSLLALLGASGYQITDEIRLIVAQCSKDFSSLMFLVKGQANAAS